MGHRPAGRQFKKTSPLAADCFGQELFTNLSAPMPVRLRSMAKSK
jgi:hypothetical protein